MTNNVFGGTLNPTLPCTTLGPSLSCHFVRHCPVLQIQFTPDTRQHVGNWKKRKIDLAGVETGYN